MAREDPQLKFRVPADLRSRLEASASESHRSLSAEIVARLESTFPRIVTAEHMPERFEDVEDEIARLQSEINELTRCLLDAYYRKALVDVLKARGEESSL